MTFSEYIQMVMRRHSFNQKLRVGQIFFNTLAEIRPDLADGLRGWTHIDCFYDDKKLGAFLEHIIQKWDA